MHDINPQKERDPVVTPVVPATPVVNPTVGPVTPVTTVVEPEYRGGPNPYPYVAGLVLLVLGIWGLFAFNNRDHRGQPERVAYVEQTLEPVASPFANRAPLQSTSNRMAEDQVRDDIREVRRQEIARDASRMDAYRTGGQTVQAEYDNQVASVDLTESASTSRNEAEPVTTSRNEAAGAPAPAIPTEISQPETTPEEANPQVAVVDLDYSEQPIQPLTEFELRAQLTQLDADLDATESMAADTGQSAGLEVLDERFDALEDRVQDAGTPLQQTDLLAMTRQVKELRDELQAFQTALREL